MQRTVYICDQCGQEIGAKYHLSLAFGGPFSGVAVPPTQPQNPTDRWQMSHKLNGKFVHFCTGKCAGNYFSALIAKAKSGTASI